MDRQEAMLNSAQLAPEQSILRTWKEKGGQAQPDTACLCSDQRSRLPGVHIAQSCVQLGEISPSDTPASGNMAPSCTPASSPASPAAAARRRSFLASFFSWRAAFWAARSALSRALMASRARLKRSSAVRTSSSPSLHRNTSSSGWMQIRMKLVITSGSLAARQKPCHKNFSSLRHKEQAGPFMHGMEGPAHRRSSTPVDMSVPE